MNLPYPPPTWADGPWKKARPALGLPLFSSPLPNTTSAYVLKQWFRQFRNDWQPLPFNTRHPNYPTYVCVGESEHQDIGGGAIVWQRTYAAVPTSYSEFETFPTTLIGIVTDSSGALPIGRPPRPYRVQSRVQYDFFLAGNTGTPSGTDNYGAAINDVINDNNQTSNGAGTDSHPITSPGNIPLIRAHIWVEQAFISSNWLGGVYYPALFTSLTTMPTTTMWNAQINDAVANSWNATVTVQQFVDAGGGNLIVAPAAGDTPNTPGPNSVRGGQIAAEDSQISRWMGNIWMRRSRYILAQ